MIKISAILLAAGLSKRMGEDKLLLSFRGSPMLRQTVDLLSELQVHERILVTTDARLKQISLPPGIRSYRNPVPEIGQSGSIRIGIEAATGTHYLFLVADQPKLTSNDIMPLLKSIDNNPDKIIYPIIASKPSSPTVFPASFRQDLLDLSGDDGGRRVRDNYPELCHPIESEHPENFIDIDSTEDYEECVNDDQ